MEHDVRRARPAGRRTAVLLAAGLFFGLSMLAWGLGLRFVAADSVAWDEMNGALLAGTLALTAAGLCHASLTLSVRDALLLFVIAFAVSLGAEYAGIRWGFPFGSHYRYHDDLVPKLAGTVPLFIPLSWFVLSYAPLVVLRKFGAAARGAAARRRVLWMKIALGAALLTCLDLFLDPLATSLGAWTWARRGIYFGIPAGNYLGWFLVGSIIYASFFAAKGPEKPAPPRWLSVLDANYVALFVLFSAAAGLAVVKQTGSVLPVVVTAAAIGPYGLYWLGAASGRPWTLAGAAEEPDAA